MLVKFRNGYFITFSAHKIESERARAQELLLSEDAENSWAWLCAAKIKPKGRSNSSAQAGCSGSLTSISVGAAGGGPRSETRLAQEQNISAQ